MPSSTACNHCPWGSKLSCICHYSGGRANAVYFSVHGAVMFCSSCHIFLAWQQSTVHTGYNAIRYSAKSDIVPTLTHM